ncbi:hypothetical protein Tco_0523070 [Tanacetum coccineum]
MYNSPKQSGVILPSKWYTSPKQSGILLPRKWYTSPKQMDSIWEHDNDLEEDQEDDGDDRERDTLEIRMLYNLLIPTTLTQPQPPNKIYVTPEHRLLNHLEKLLEDQVLNVADRSMKRPYPTRDLEEPKDSLRMGQDKLQDSIWEHDNDLEEDQEDDGDDRDTFDM